MSIDRPLPLVAVSQKLEASPHSGRLISAVAVSPLGRPVSVRGFGFSLRARFTMSGAETVQVGKPNSGRSHVCRARKSKISKHRSDPVRPVPVAAICHGKLLFASRNRSSDAPKSTGRTDSIDARRKGGRSTRLRRQAQRWGHSDRDVTGRNRWNGPTGFPTAGR